MKHDTILEARLLDWGKEYGGGKYDHVGWPSISPLAQMMKYHGRSPQGLNPSRVTTDGLCDQVELAVRALESQRGGIVPASVLRCEYYADSAPRQVKLQRLARVGQRMDSTRYSHHLRLAKVHVAAWLRLPFDEPLDDVDSIAMLEHLVVA